MGRKKLDPEQKFLQELDESESARYFRWEFLRRNAQFQEECAKIIADTNAALGMPREDKKAFAEILARDIIKQIGKPRFWRASTLSTMCPAVGLLVRPLIRLISGYSIQ